MRDVLERIAVAVERSNELIEQRMSQWDVEHSLLVKWLETLQANDDHKKAINARGIEATKWGFQQAIEYAQERMTKSQARLADPMSLGHYTAENDIAHWETQIANLRRSLREFVMTWEGE